ncbi:hypothetical protein L198_00409 [Cryptococcus wingfieldii CBS 7118]|uniref:Pentatricopeptide repeat domain-containing protein n=1 Tax=Cryptococcus wingfieldii CBS 7118 TaxID=1295528 RepID=A0A1E3K6X9_9TREE|nr:hypothetical protein L198_00409 [Cryptococcus wingfieldii CBS 7118]ODO08676.1 hypothetical protein L198_00409 [Cryptococcus wingfieldii CBS 7118]
MSSGIRHQAVKGLALLGRTAPSKPVCVACQANTRLHAQSQSHSNNAWPRQTRKSNEFAVGSQGSPRATAPKHKVTDSLLKAQFQAAWNHSPQPVPKQVLHAAYPLVFRRTLRSHLDPHIRTIAPLVAPLLEERDLSAEERRQILVLLGHCYLCTAAKGLFVGQNVQRIGDVYGRALVREALGSLGNVEQLRTYLDGLESVLKGLSNSGATPVLGPEIVGAWAVLRESVGVKGDTNQSYVWPRAQDVQEFMADALKATGADGQNYSEALSTLMSAGKPSDHLPRTKDALEAELASMRNRGDWEAIVLLWRNVYSALSHDTSAEGILDPSPDIRFSVLSSFLLTFRRPVPHLADIPVDPPPPAFTKYASEVLSLCPKPLPKVIAYTLLALRVRPDEDTGLRAGHEVFELGTDERRSGEQGALSNLKSTWKESGERDLKMYMMYLEGLGRLGDLDGLKEAWGELVEDEACKHDYLREEKLRPDSPFPPIHALNQMISACLLIPLDGPIIALDLFSQASRADSAIPCNLITINTVLRHHAREADIPSMSTLFQQAVELGLAPDVVTYTTLVQGLLRARRLDLAKSAMDMMHKQGIVPNQRMCSMLIADLAKPGTKLGLEHAEEMLRLMYQKNMRTNEVTWTALISGYFYGGWDGQAWEAIERMERLGIRLNRVAYNMMLRQLGTGEGETVDTMMMLWHKLLRQKINPNSDTYLLLLSALSSASRWAEVDEVMREMTRREYKPEKGALARLIDNIDRKR